MLKIKENADLKELEKYGFTYTSGDDWHRYFDNIEISLGDSREIIIDLNYNDFCETEITLLIDLLYDLIQAGLVEKVD